MKPSRFKNLVDDDIFIRYENEILKLRKENASKKPNEWKYNVRIGVTYGVRRIEEKTYVLTIFCHSSNIDSRTGGGGFHIKGAFFQNSKLAAWILQYPAPMPEIMNGWEGIAYIATIERRYRKALGAKLFYGV